MVEIFKTDIQSKQAAVEILHSLQFAFPDYKMNFDLDDCDKILRIESTTVNIKAVQGVLVEMGVVCSLIDL